VFQFEITGDLLPIELIDYLNHHAPKGLFRFEIGIQSTHLATNLAVDRHQNTEKLLSNIRLIQEAGIIDLHLDLIAGLPEENLERFTQTFDEVFSLYPKELQLGFLKMLRGTKIRREASKYGYVYDDKPPYEIIRNDSLSESDLSEIHLTEAVLEIFWNKGYMPESMLQFIKSGRSAFASMNAFAHHLVDTSFDFHRFQLSDLFERLYAYVQIRSPESSQSLFDSLKFEYLLRSRIKPKLWWDHSFEKANKNAILRRFQERHPDLKIDELYKYAVVTAYRDQSLIVVYKPDKMTYYTE
jgi:anaerobic magnesium-protoporphyrin IX monomethyl ester cyclase